MKDVFKGVAIKILSIIVIIAILGGVAYGGYRYMKTKAEANKGHETVNNIEVITINEQIWKIAQNYAIDFIKESKSWHPFAHRKR